MSTVQPIGYWGSVTSAHDWCEVNYSKTFYIAEFYNTISSFFFVVLAAIGLHFSRKYSYPIRFTVCYLFLGFVGFGSVLFHGTLSYTGQFLDEVPMLLTVGWFAYSLIDENRTADGKLLSALIVYDMLLSYTYLFVPFYFHFFLAIYVSMVAVLCIYSFRLAFNTSNAPSPQQSYYLRLLVLLSMGSYVGGSILLWVPDFFFCEYVHESAHLHAWFHLTSGLGAYSFVVFATLVHYIRLQNTWLKCSQTAVGGSIEYPIMPVGTPVQIYVDHISATPVFSVRIDIASEKVN